MTAPNKELRATFTAARDAYAAAHCNGDNVKANTKIAEITLGLQPDFGTVTSPRLCEKPELAGSVLAELTRLTAKAARPDTSTRSRNRDVPKVYAPLTVCGSDVKIEKLEFFWPGLMPWGYPFLLGGDPGLNKSTLTVDTAARASRGEFWPCSTECAPIVNSLFITAEDGVSDVIMPRYLEAGGDPSRVFFMKGKVDTDGKESGIDLRLECIPAIEKAIQQHQAKLVVIDPVSAYLAGIDSHNDAEVRAMLLPVQEIAARNKCVIVLVLHFNKDGSKSGLHRFMGSVAFSAVCRAAFGVVKDRNDPKKRLFLPIKANLAPDTRGLEFYVNDSNGHPKITWGADFSNTTIDEALMPEDHQSKQDRAMFVIQAGLAERGGEMDRDALFALTQSKKIGSKATYAALKDLKTLVGLEKQPSGFGGKWIYTLPKVDISTNDDFDAPYAAPQEAESSSSITAVAESAQNNSWEVVPESVPDPTPAKTNGHAVSATAPQRHVLSYNIAQAPGAQKALGRLGLPILGSTTRNGVTKLTTEAALRYPELQAKVAAEITKGA